MLPRGTCQPLPDGACPTCAPAGIVIVTCGSTWPGPAFWTPNVYVVGLPGVAPRRRLCHRDRQIRIARRHRHRSVTLVLLLFGAVSVTGIGGATVVERTTELPVWVLGTGTLTWKLSEPPTGISILVGSAPVPLAAGQVAPPDAVHVQVPTVSPGEAS